jgi:predicted NUDIX family NTP pyrophosphohydrolase
LTLRFPEIYGVIESAGLIVYRRSGQLLEVLLVHPSGNYNRRAPWGIPKGLPEKDEPLADAAIRETREETGLDLNDPAVSSLVSLGFIEYTRSRKRVHAFAFEAWPEATPRVASWEVDRAEFLPLEEARRLIHPDQLPLLDRLEEYLAANTDPT